MKTLIIILSMTALLIGGSVQLAMADEKEEKTEKKEDEAKNPTMICENLAEQISIFAPLQQATSDDFARITDVRLCPSMSSQCEDFTLRMKKLYKEYRSECQDDFEMPVVAKCDYTTNPCIKKPRQAQTNVRRPSVADWYLPHL